MRMLARQYWTADMVRELPEDRNRYEVVYGELLVSPGPRELHDRVLMRLNFAVYGYVKRERVGAVYGDKCDISWRPDTLVQPDLLVADLEQARTGTWVAMQRLLLAVEILSPSSIRADRYVKRALYQRYGVETYWIVDADEKLVEIWTPDATFPATVEETLRWRPAGAATELAIDLAELFSPL